MECKDSAGCTSEEELLKVMLSTSLQEHRPGVVSMGITTAGGHGSILNPHGSAFSLLGQGQGAALPQRYGAAGGPATHPSDIFSMPLLAWHDSSELQGPVPFVQTHHWKIFFGLCDVQAALTL